jgi:endonuclease/exonuclease/phosphatase (EEP) superfamily protein YafD
MDANPPAPPLKRRAGLLLIGIVLAFGSATLLGFAGRQGWLLELCTHFRVQYFWALALAALALGLLGRSRWSVTAATLALVNLAAIVPLYFGPAEEIALDHQLRCISLNVNFQNEDYGRTIELIRAEEPDWVLLIEVTPEWCRAMRAIENEYPYVHANPTEDSGGIALYSRIPFKDVNLQDLYELRVHALLVEFNLPGGPLTFIGAHPASPSSSTYFAMRNRQLGLLAELVQRQKRPLMLMGDLNTTGWSPFFRDLLANSGLKDTRRGFGVEGSWPGVPLPLRIPIDHCLVTEGVVIVARRIGESIGSDHRPVIVDFALPER